MSVVQIGNATLIHGDAIEILPTLQADCIVTDPPYKLTSGGTPEGGLHERLGGEGYDNSGSIVTCDIDWPDFMPLLYNALRGDAHAYVMSNYRNLEDMFREARAAGFRLHNLLPWDKGTATPSRQYMRNYEFTGLFFKGAAKTINNPGDMAGVYVQQEDYGGHPTSKPTALMEYYIRNSTQPSETVLDPFMGVGSTAVGALRAGRNFIGIEIEKKWYDKAVQRVKEYYNTPQDVRML